MWKWEKTFSPLEGLTQHKHSLSYVPDFRSLSGYSLMGMALGIGDGGNILVLLSFCMNVMFGLEVLPEIPALNFTNWIESKISSTKNCTVSKSWRCFPTAICIHKNSLQTTVLYSFEPLKCSLFLATIFCKFLVSFFFESLISIPFYDTWL